jgi:hypothetical protein
MTIKGNHWAIEKRGREYLGADGRYWIRGVRSSSKKNAQRREVVVMEQKLGHPIPKGYVVHHKDEDITNDDPDNLELLKHSDHSRLHHKGKSNPSKGVHQTKHYRSGLTDTDISDIKKLYLQEGYSQQQIANKYFIHQTMVSKIIRNY